MLKKIIHNTYYLWMCRQKDIHVHTDLFKIISYLMVAIYKCGYQLGMWTVLIGLQSLCFDTRGDKK